MGEFHGKPDWMPNGGDGLGPFGDVGPHVWHGLGYPVVGPSHIDISESKRSEDGGAGLQARLVILAESMIEQAWWEEEDVWDDDDIVELFALLAARMPSDAPPLWLEIVNSMRDKLHDDSARPAALKLTRWILGLYVRERRKAMEQSSD